MRNRQFIEDILDPNSFLTPIVISGSSRSSLDELLRFGSMMNKSLNPTNFKISYFLHQCFAIDSSHTYYRLFCLTVVFVDDDDSVVG